MNNLLLACYLIYDIFLPMIVLNQSLYLTQTSVLEKVLKIFLSYWNVQVLCGRGLWWTSGPTLWAFWPFPTVFEILMTILGGVYLKKNLIGCM